MRLFHSAVVATTASLLLTLTISGCRRKVDAGPVNADKSTSATNLDRVVAGPPIRKPLVLYSTQPARIEAFEETPLYAKLAGYVDVIAVDIGDAVKNGQTLVKLKIPELKNEVDQKIAMLAQSKAEAAQADANISAVKAAAETAAAHVKEAKAGVGRTTADFERWEAEHARITGLAATGSVTSKLVDETKNQLRAADAAREESAAAIDSAEAAARQAAAMVAKSEADLRAAEARVAVAKANLDQAQTMLTYTELKAPFDGVVISRSIDPGHFVQPASGAGAKPLVVVARTDKVRVALDIPEMEAGLVDVGDEAILRVQALRGRELKAAVSRTSWSLDSGNRSLRAEVDFPNDNSLLRPGMYATGVIKLDHRPNALTLPVTAVVRVGNDAYCCLVEKGKIVRRQIELGLRSGPDVEVLHGIDESNVVVLVRPEGLADGQAVEVISAGA